MSNKSGSGTLEKVLMQASAAIRQIDNGSGTLDEALDRCDGECRRSIEHLLAQVYRFRKSIRASWSKFCRSLPSPEISALLDAALTQCRFQSSVMPQSVVNVAVTLARKKRADKFVNAVLRNALRENFTMPSSAAEILPDALLKRWKRNFPAEQVEKMASLFLKKPEFTFRLCGETPLPPGAVAIPAHEPFRFASGKAAEILHSTSFVHGGYYIQDPATSLSVSLAGEVLPQCHTLLDLCAAPGGKTLMAAELLPAGAQITAADISAYRQKFTAENFSRHMVAAKIITADPSQITGSYQLVIADVPCSNSGVFRRRPDALWRFSEKSLADVMMLQRQILRQAERLTAPGGWLLVSTCSIEPDENEALLQTGSGFELLDQQTLYPGDTHDGAFAALFKKLK